MKNLSLSARNIIVITTYLFLTAAFFAGGYCIGFNNGKGALSGQYVTASTSSAVPTVFPISTLSPARYRVILEDSELRLYIDENGTGRLISNEKVSEESFPAHDIATLKEGKSFDTLDEALVLMENFLS